MIQPQKPVVHIFGAGLAGLACAVRLVQKGGHKHFNICLYDAASSAGGRTRSFQSKKLQTAVDNGTHLAMKSNKNLFAYLAAIGAKNRIAKAQPTGFPFVDISSGKGWQLRPNIYNPACWFFAKNHRVPEVSAKQHKKDFISLFKAKENHTLAEAIDRQSPLFPLLWKPLAESVLNTAPEQASAQLLKNVFTKSALHPGNGFTPYLAKQDLCHCFITPALEYLQRHGVNIYLRHKLRQLLVDDSKAAQIITSHNQRKLLPHDRVVLALPFAQTSKLLPDLTVPQGYGPIINVHFLTSQPLTLPDNAKWLGLANATSHWLFVRGNITSVTISAADYLATVANDKLAHTVWQDICAARGRAGGFLPAYQVVRSKQATFLQTPQNNARRPESRTWLSNLFLAGDYTDTGLPCTMEGAVYSGYKAASNIL